MLYGLDVIETRFSKVITREVLGYFTKTKLPVLENIVKENITDIWETCFKYAIIFKIPENTLYFGAYMSIYKAYRVVIPTPFNLDKVKYEEIPVESLPKDIRLLYSNFNLDQVIEESREG